MARASGKRASRSSATEPGWKPRASSWQSGQVGRPTLAKSNRRRSAISVAVPTVDRAVRTGFFCSMAIAGLILISRSTSGRSTFSRNMRAYVDNDSTYRHWPSANKVSNASEDFPEPDTPVIAVTALWGILSEMFLRLFCRAPSTMRSPDGWISFKGNLVRYGLSQRQFDERDAAQVEREGAGHGGPEAETVQGQDHEAHVGEPRRDEPEEVFGIAH